MVSPARAAAFDILLRVGQQRAYAAELLHSHRLQELSPADRALCTELTMGVLRWQARLDSVIGPLCSQPLPRLDPEVLIALRLAAYQIGFLERVPARAAVNESVELVKRARKRSAAPFVNGVLRKLASDPARLSPAKEQAGKIAAGIADSYAHPAWLVERWAAAYGLKITETICAYDQEPPALAVRLRSPEAEQELSDEGVHLAPGVLLASARRLVSGDLARSRVLADGRTAIQDEASQLVALLLGSGARLLDCCAAPGGKTAVLAERNPQSLIVAADLHPHRVRLLARRLPAEGKIRVLAGDATQLPLRGGFDRVLADVPCSGTGTLARNPEIKWRLQPGDLADLHRKQVAILSAALEQLAPGGRLLYSTCSLEREENADVVEEVLGTRGDFRLLDCRPELERLRAAGELLWPDLESLLSGPFLRTIPGLHPCDGFFAALLERK